MARVVAVVQWDVGLAAEGAAWPVLAAAAVDLPVPDPVAVVLAFPVPVVRAMAVVPASDPAGPDMLAPDAPADLPISARVRPMAAASTRPMAIIPTMAAGSGLMSAAGSVSGR